jgi:hypothetical protein
MKPKLLLCLALVLSGHCYADTHATGTNYSAPDVRYYCPGIIIGNAGTNKVMAGVWTMGDQFNFEVEIMAVPSSFQASRALPEYRPDPAFGAFLKPPGKVKFLKVELRGQDGRVLAPVQKLDDSLPSTLPVKAFLQYAQKERHAGNIDFQDRLYRSPSELGEFTIQNAYRIEKEGDYTLTVCCAIYILPYNGHPPANVDYDKYQTLSATRVDLPCVTTKIHLAPP